VNGKIVADGPTREVMSNVELLASASIKPPQTVQLAQGLREYGYNLNMLTLDEAVEELKRLLDCRRSSNPSPVF
ncbi:MAG: hypothetical protein QW544_05100, partial [Candidatus Caldarchaeum sp.]